MTDSARVPPSIALIAALSSNRVIGRDNNLPWRLPQDLKRFKALTMGKAIMMGRRTFESIGRALPGRKNLVVTRNRVFEAPGCRVLADIDAALAAAADCELMVIGGAQIYAQTLSMAQRLHLTWVDAEIEGDAMFPEFDAEQWQVLSEEAHPPDERHAFAYRFVDYQRRS
ncbi:MAG: dihydrofolate reductase [Gammaproteobacteria bacterium]|jgi:dihydrofolate reductase